MSTELLHTPGKVHTLYDDLESHFFVILYNALHFLKHVRPPGLNMESIFDDAFISPVTGFHYGGRGKRGMYDSHDFTFESKPLTGLICALLELFRSLKNYSCKHFKKERFPTAVEDVEKLKDCAEIKRLYAEALGSKGWPTVCDKVEDRYPPTRCSTSQQTEPVVLSYFGCGPTAEPSAGKRKREDDAPLQPQQRRKKKRSKGRKRQ